MVDREFWKTIGAAGLLGLTIDEELGGWGGDAKCGWIFEEEQYVKQLPTRNLRLSS